MKKINFLFLAAMVGLLSGCSLGSEPDQVVTPVSIQAFYNANPDAGDINLYYNLAQVNVGGFPYKSIINYFQTPPGTNKVKVTSTSSGATLIDTTFTLLEFSGYSTFITKRSAASSKLIAITTRDMGTLSSQSNIMLRVANLSPDSPAIVAKVVGDGSNLATDLTFQQISPFREYIGNDMSIEIRRSSDNVLLLTIPIVTSTGSFQTIILSGYVSPPNGNINNFSYKIMPNA